MYIVLPEVAPIDNRIMTCARGLKEKGLGDVQQADVAVSGLVAMGFNCGLDVPELLEIQLLVFTRREFAPYIELRIPFI